MSGLQVLIQKIIDGKDFTLREATELHSYPKKQIYRMMDKLNGKVKLYYYMLTFTLDPKKNDFSDDFYDTVEEYICKQMKRTPLRVTEAHVVREGSDEDQKHTHWHASVITEKPLKKDRFSYYQKLYGNIDVSKSQIKSNNEHLDYMSKQSTPKRVV